jgi:hypothetical protein
MKSSIEEQNPGSTTSMTEVRNMSPSAEMAYQRVGFLVAGTQKGGTTALDFYLRQHPQLCMASRKEVHFFDNDDIYAGNVKPDYSYYHQFFRPTPYHVFLGETTPSYMYWQPVPQRIQHYNPDMKWIFILRNPIDRAYSHWNMARYLGKESRPFLQAIEQEIMHLQGKSTSQLKVHAYVNRGFYWQQLSRIWNLFPREQTLILRNEELRVAPQSTLSKVWFFLGVSELNNIQAMRRHTRPYTSSMEGQAWDVLKNIYEKDVNRLEAELKWNCSDWLSNTSRTLSIAFTTILASLSDYFADVIAALDWV